MLSSFVLIFGGLIFDYFLNARTVSVSLYEIKSYDIQESFTIKGEIYTNNNVNYIKNPVGMPKGIREGAYAEVKLSGKTYEGYLRELETLSDDSAVACVSVVSDKKLYGEAEARVYGNIIRNVILVPKKYIFRDEKGKNAVMIASRGYVVKRNIELGTLKNENGIEVVSGLLEDEKIVINYKDVKTGDKYEKNY